MTSDGISSKLDGNAAGGLLLEVFAFEATAAQTTCAGCASVSPLGELRPYAIELGAILQPVRSGMARPAVAQFEVLRKHGTEPAGSSPLDKEHSKFGRKVMTRVCGLEMIEHLVVDRLPDGDMLDAFERPESACILPVHELGQISAAAGARNHRKLTLLV